MNQRVAVTGRGHGQANVYAAYPAFTGQFVDDVDLIRLGARRWCCSPARIPARSPVSP